PQPNRFGFVVPPLAPWLGWSLAVSLVFFSLRRFGQAITGSKQNLKWAASGGAGILFLFVVVRLAFPQWLAVNGAGLAWGTALPLLAWTVLAGRPKWVALALWGLILAGLLMVYYGLALAAFAATVCVVTGLLFLAL